MQISDQAGEKLSSIPTAEEYFLSVVGESYKEFNISIVDCMVGFAKIHLSASVKGIQERVFHDIEIDWVDPYDYSAGHNGIKGDIDRESIPDFYPLTNIK